MASPLHVRLTRFEVSPVLASPETLHLLPGTRDDLGLQLLLHVGPWLGSSWGSERVGLDFNHLGIPSTCDRA